MIRLACWKLVPCSCVIVCTFDEIVVGLPIALEVVIFNFDLQLTVKHFSFVSREYGKRSEDMVNYRKDKYEKNL